MWSPCNLRESRVQLPVYTPTPDVLRHSKVVLTGQILKQIHFEKDTSPDVDNDEVPLIKYKSQNEVTFKGLLGLHKTRRLCLVCLCRSGLLKSAKPQSHRLEKYSKLLST